MKAAKKILLILFALMALFVLSILSCYQFVRISVSHASTDKLHQVPTRKIAIVLGTTSKLANGQPNPYFYNRVDAAAELYKAGKVKTILVSGCGGPYYNEPRDITRALTNRGVPKSSIITDPEGYRTLDSLLRAKMIFRLHSFTIISQPFHVHRALYICQQHGIDASGYETKSVNDVDLWIWNIGREHLARVKMMQDLYFLDTMPKSMKPVQSPPATSVAK